MSDTIDQLPDAIVEILKTAPPASVTTLSFFGYPVADLAQVMVLTWMFFLILSGTYRFYRWWRKGGWRRDLSEDRSLGFASFKNVPEEDRGGQ